MSQLLAILKKVAKFSLLSSLILTYLLLFIYVNILVEITAMFFKGDYLKNYMKWIFVFGKPPTHFEDIKRELNPINKVFALLWHSIIKW